MTDVDLHALFQQMGEVISSVDALRDTIRLRQEQSEQLHGYLRSDLSSLRSDHGDLEEKLDCVICIMQNDLEALRSDAKDNSRAVDDLVHAVQALRRPIAEITALRSRVAGVLFSIGVIGSIAVWLAEPLYHWLVESNLSRR